MGDSFL
jgi:hypothetical protein